MFQDTPLKTTLGISANYRGLSVALAVSPTPYKSPGIGGTGRFGATYSWKNYFTGFSSVVQSSYVGIGNPDMGAGNTWIKVEVFWGLRL